MSEHDDLPRSEDESRGRELREAVIGLAGAVVLTIIAFALAIAQPFAKGALLIGLGVLALIQIGWHFRYFLHIDLESSHRDDLQLVLFTGLIVLLMVAGTIWILFNQHMRMG